MLYIKFNIEDPSKYIDFQKLYNHMVEVRQPGYKFKEEDGPEIDWDSLTDQEMTEVIDKLFEEPEVIRYKEFIPDYAHQFLGSYVGFENERAGDFGFETSEIFNYLEFSFEVELDNLERKNENDGLIEFSTGNFPFGGIERFLITLKAFDIRPAEYFDGFAIHEVDWTSDFAYDTIELPGKTSQYLKGK
ncbi:hypothetical protein R9C00_15970 [Flammeovirgaceae bacterium SG7u.111]|nr:hypothetical protein [Flammeovirgaceae bacterium SG7u.132]WPO33199.1 hypothetical protein R9C00_15970 [Flammeovirgaceae bacterium SG7u.111]